MKRILVIIAALLIVLTGGLTAAALLIDWDGLRKEVLARAGRAAGLAVAFDGEIGFRLLPQPTLTLEGVRIGPAGTAGDATILAAETIEVAPSLLDLIGGRIVVHQVTLNGVSLALQRDEKGRGNWEDLIAAVGAMEEEGGANPIDLRIRRGTIFLQDRRAGLEETIGGIAARLSVPGAVGSYRLEASFGWRGLPVTVTGSASVPDSTGRLPFDLAVKSGGLASGALTGRAVLATGAMEQGRLKLQAADLNELLAKLGEPRLVPASLKTLDLEARVAGAAGAASADEIRLRLGASTATGSLKARLGAVPGFDLALQVAQLPLDPLLEPPARQGPSRNLALPRGVEGSVTVDIAAAPFRGSALRSLRLDATLKDGIVQVAELKGLAPGGTLVGVAGQVLGTADGLRLDGQLTGQTDDLRAFLAWLGADLHGIAPARLRRATATGHVVVDDDGLSIDELRAEFDSSFAQGSLRLPWDEKADLALDLALDRLDTDAYLAPDQAPQQKRPAAKPAASGIAARIAVERLTALAKPLQNARAELRVFRDVATLQSFSAEIPGAATLVGSGELRERNGVVAFDGNAEVRSPEPGALVRWFGVAPSPGLQALRPLTIAAGISLAGDKLAARDIVASLGDTHFTGTASIDYAGGRPRIDADVAIDDWIVPWAQPLPDSAPAPETGATRIDFSWVSGFDLNLRASAKALHALRYTLQDVRAVARVREHVVELERLTGQAYGGWIRARGSVDAGGERPAFTASVEAGDVSLEPLLGDAAGVDEMTGTLALSVQVKGSGATNIEMIRGSDGNGKIVASNGALRGFDLARIARRLAKVENIGDLGGLMAATEAGGETAYSLVQGNITINSGVVRSDDLQLFMEGGTGKANGWVDVAGLNISMRGDVTFDDVPGKPSIGLVVRGSLDEPERELKTGEIRSYIQRRINDAALGKAAPPPAESAVEEALPTTIELPKPPRRFRK